MDKQLLKAYIRTIVEEEVERVLPKLLGEAVQEIKKIQQVNESVATPIKSQSPKIDRSRLAELMGIDYDRQSGTITATTANINPQNTFTAMDSAGNRVQVPATSVDPSVRDALTKDYSALMKKMKLT